MQQQQAEEGFYLDQAKVLEVGKKIKHIEGKLNLMNMLEMLYEDCNAYVELIEESHDQTLESEVEDSLHKLEEEVEKAKIQTLLKGKYDSGDAIITIHAGAGGTEAQDWADMLYRMYKMYCDKAGFKMLVLDVLNGDEAGLKSITFEVSGDNAYGFLRQKRAFIDW